MTFWKEEGHYEAQSSKYVRLAIAISNILRYYNSYAERSLLIMDIGIALCVTLVFIGLIAYALIPAVVLIIYCIYCIKTHRKFQWHEYIHFI